MSAVPSYRVKLVRQLGIAPSTSGWKPDMYLSTPLPHKLVDLQGFEPQPSESKSLVLPLHHRSIKIGGYGEVRTRDPLIKSQVLLPAELRIHKIGTP